MGTVFFIIFLLSMVVGIPVYLALAIPPIIQVFLSGETVYYSLLFQRFSLSLENFTLLALPMFILAGGIMGRGGITSKIISFSQSLIGHRKGGLGHVVILSSTIFSALTGSAVAATSAIGRMMIPEMERNGFSTKYAAAITATSTVLGPIIPPSGIMLIYAVSMNISVGAMFIAAIIPGIIFSGSLMVVNYFLCLKKGFTQTTPKQTFKERVISFRGAFLALLTPVIILGGIYGGIFTPTEAAAIAVTYATIVCLFLMRTLKPKDMVSIVKESVASSAGILLLVAVATSFATIVSLSSIPDIATRFLNSIDASPYIVFAIVNLLLFLIGMFLDAGPAILIFAPILGPPLFALGIDPLHFGVVMSINVTVGLVTPPMGLVLFVASNISKVSLEKIALEALPLILVEIAIIFLITFCPILVTWLPSTMGF